MNPHDLAVTFTSGQLAVLLIASVILLVGLGKWAVQQFQKGVDAGFERLEGQLDGLKKDMASRPTRIEMENHVSAIHRRIDDHMGIPPLQRRRATDETFPGVG